MKPRLYTQYMEFLGVLENATHIGYSHVCNDLWHCHFSLPMTDPMILLCEPHTIVDIFKDGKSKGKYRILRQPQVEISKKGAFLKYECEHVVCFLIDDVIEGYHEIGGADFKTGDCINYMLDKQTTRRWNLGQCDYEMELQYKFENTTLLAAILEIPKMVDTNYHFEYDTDSYPFTMKLIKLENTPNCVIRKGVNQTSIHREIDASKLITRLYCKGYGEGINQLNIADVNGGLKYIDADTINKWGVKASFMVDSKVENAETLLARGREALEEVKNPYISYRASAIDLSSITGDDWHEFDEGKMVLIHDELLGEDVVAKIVEYAQDDIEKDPLGGAITIANKTQDVAQSIAELLNRSAISLTYSQGSTNLYSQQFADNADPTHPAVMRVYIPKGCVRINQILLSWKLEKFRAYETGAAAGGAAASTSSAGGGGTYTTVQSAEPQGTTGDATWSGGTDSGHPIAGNSSYGGHSHSIKPHKHSMSLIPHSHRVNISSHTHSFSLPEHTHAMVYGIYDGGKASSVSILVDGNALSLSGETEIDIAKHLTKDSNGKIKRGSWHEIKIVPNALTRIEANLFVQTFIQSIGGGDY